MQRAAVLAAALVAGAATAASAQDFYAGKTLTFLIGSDAGGGYDVYARTIARHLPKHLPGAPTIVARNQPGAGSGTAAAAIFTTAPKDGTWIGAIFPGVIIGPILDPKPKTLFDPTKFVYLASADSGTRVCVTRANSAVRSFKDALANKAIMGASAAGGSTRDYAAMVANIAGAKFEIVSGYKGTVDIFLAMERGEVDGMCGLDWSSLKSQRPDWLRDKKINILVQTALEPEKELTELGVPIIWDFVAKPEDRQAAELVVSQQIFGRPYIAPPETPAAQVEALRQAFSKTLADPDFLADAEKSRIDVAPSSGAVVQDVVRKIFAASPQTVERAKAIITPAAK
jgi:tripartite-type tricarboxylate transporter receptor subunit TctC